MSEDDKILRPNFNRKNSISIEDVPVERKFCRHRNVTLSEESRSVYCSNCNFALDAFKVLLEYANLERRDMVLGNDMHEKMREIEKLKKEEKLIKARIKRARETAAKQRVLFE